VDLAVTPSFPSAGIALAKAICRSVNLEFFMANSPHLELHSAKSQHSEWVSFFGAGQ
jgi:hypothetical protein